MENLVFRSKCLVFQIKNFEILGISCQIFEILEIPSNSIEKPRISNEKRIILIENVVF